MIQLHQRVYNIVQHVRVWLPAVLVSLDTYCARSGTCVCARKCVCATERLFSFSFHTETELVSIHLAELESSWKQYG